MHGVLTRGMVGAAVIVMTFGCSGGANEQTAEKVGSASTGAETLTSSVSPGTDGSETDNSTENPTADPPVPIPGKPIHPRPIRRPRSRS